MAAEWNADEKNFFFTAKDQTAELLLLELIDNGRASVLNDGQLFAASHEEVVAMDAFERFILNLPDLYPYILRVDREGDMHDSDFAFKYAFYENSTGGARGSLVYGSIVRFENTPFGDKQWLLKKPQFEICRLIDSFNNSLNNSLRDGADGAESSSLSSVLRTLKRVQELAADDAAVELDLLLKGTRIETPETIGVEIEPCENGIVVEARLPDTEIDQKRFAKKIASSRAAQDIYTESLPGGDRCRVVFSPPQSKELQKFRKKIYSGDDLEKLRETPQEIFDPDIVDLDSFSARVREIGYCKAKYYPFIVPYKSDWFAEGLGVETPDGTRRQTIIADEESLEQLKEAIERAENTGASSVSLPVTTEDGTDTGDKVEFGLSEAKELYARAKKRLADKAQKAGKNSTLGVIIDENIEEVEYEVGLPLESGEALRCRFEAPPHLDSACELLPHQKEGIAWMQKLARINSDTLGFLLADDMGLGKTLQALAFLEWHHKNVNRNDAPYLIVAPVALLENWEMEYKRFFPTGSFFVIRAYGQDEAKDLHPSRLVLTTYETLRKRQLFFCSVRWAVAVLDEAQKIKTPGTLTTTAAKALNADIRIAMTGTPVENTLVDLWSIVDYAMPSLLGSAKDFAHRYQKTYQNREEITETGEELKKRLGIFFKRRLKEDILTGLPEKKDYTHRREMPLKQFSAYESVLKDIRSAKESGNVSKGHVLAHLQKLRDVSDHPFLVTHSDAEWAQFPVDALIESSAKLLILQDILRQVETKREKVILFAIRKPVQRILQRVACSVLRLDSADVSIINGETPVHETAANETRQGAIDRFQKRGGAGCIVLSPLAAGFGLNITEANHVVHYSRHWNPAKENQATDRVYRIGQKRPVFVHYPMAVADEYKTFDDILSERIENKRALARGVLFPTEQVEVTAEELFNAL
jgi:SNF2 family DNA or RNA helicase